MARPNLGEKDILNPEEAIKYWNLSRRKFYQFLGKRMVEIILPITKQEYLSSVWHLNSIYTKIQR